LPRTQDSIAASCDGRWVLINASPDLRQQILVAGLTPPPGTRESPISDVVLTDAELDHVCGLLLLREARRLRVHGTEAVLGALTLHLALDRTIGAYAGVEWCAASSRTPVEACNGKLQIEVIGVGKKRPRYVANSLPPAGGHWVSALRLREAGGNRTVLHAPCLGEWTDGLTEVASGCACVVVDGTFWSDDELVGCGLSSRTAREMGHLPIGGPGGSLQHLAKLEGIRRIYTHINNSNPILDPSSKERAEVVGAGIEVGADGMVIEA
jgi:pyrroloquinoline quinone biosynthesis protein B